MHYVFRHSKHTYIEYLRLVESRIVVAAPM